MIWVAAIFAIACATSLIKYWLTRNDSLDKESFNRLARAFMQHKKEMEQRVQDLEAIIADVDKSGMNYQDIQVPRDKGSLTNDLQNKNKVQS